MIKASHQFLYGTTAIPMDSRDPNSRTRVTKLLCMTSSPEEKRKTIGDVFVKVSLSVCDVDPVDIWRTEHQAGCRTFMLCSRSLCLPLCWPSSCISLLPMIFPLCFYLCNISCYVLIMFKPEEEVIILLSICFIRIWTGLIMCTCVAVVTSLSPRMHSCIGSENSATSVHDWFILF